jgi:hypothetical protein
VSGCRFTGVDARLRNVTVRARGFAWCHVRDSIGISILALLSPLAFRNAHWLRPLFLFVAVVAGLLNATGHTVATILGHTVSTVRFERPAPGFYSSPLLAIVSFYALLLLWRARREVDPNACHEKIGVDS